MVIRSLRLTPASQVRIGGRDARVLSATPALYVDVRGGVLATEPESDAVRAFDTASRRLIQTIRVPGAPVPVAVVEGHRPGASPDGIAVRNG